MAKIIAGVRAPDSALAGEVEQLVRDTESELLYHHSNRVFLFGALAGERKNLKVDLELLYVGAMFHDMGLQAPYASADERFEVDGANAAAAFMRAHDIDERDVEDVWDAIALHTTPGIPKHKRPVVALVTAGVEMDVLGIEYDAFTPEQRDEVCASHPRGHDFKNGIIDAFACGTIKKPETTFGNVKADVLALRDPTYRRVSFTDVILNSKWAD
ncbi:MAG: hypothetical protein JWQ46_683 [Phenylobacterium sp.]|jgi:hypothetical protein|nr:hypothetical protein [Phenylobacterium sp.]MDB5465921.1 hypothetical protein [Phenylobacterium sp.]